MLSMKRVIRIALFVCMITGLFLTYSYRTARQNQLTRETLAVEEQVLLTNTITENGRSQSDKPRYYLMGQGLVQQNLAAFCDDADIQCYDRFLDQNIVEDGRSTLIFATNQPLSYMTPQRLYELVSRGVHVMFAAGIPKEQELWSLAGIETVDGREAPRLMRFQKGFLPFAEEEMPCPEYGLSDLIRPTADVTPLVWDAETGVPVVYDRQEGKAGITVFNTTLLENAGNLGLFTGALGRLEGDFLYPVIGRRFVFLDNIPMGSAQGDDLLPIRGQGESQFVRDRVFPVFAKYAMQYHVPYTMSVPMVDIHTQELSFRQEEFWLTLAQEIMKMEGEITMGADFGRAESLTFNDSLYLAFLNRYPEYHMQGLEEEAGIMDVGKRALVQSYYPDLKVVRRPLYDLDGNYNFGNSLVDESGLVTLPVYSEGTGEDGSWIWNAAMSVSARGCLSHSLDMGELMDLKHGTGGWEENALELEDFWKRGPGEAWWLPASTLTRGVNALRGYDAVEYDLRWEGRQLFILPERYLPGQTFYLRTERPLKACEGGRAEPISENYYLLTVHENRVVLTFRK